MLRPRLRQEAMAWMRTQQLEEYNALTFEQHRVTQLASSRPLLIIDEADELSNAVTRKLKRLHMLTEGQLGVLIAHTLSSNEGSRDPLAPPHADWLALRKYRGHREAGQYEHILRSVGLIAATWPETSW